MSRLLEKGKMKNGKLRFSFKYVPAVDTDVRATFNRFRKQQQTTPPPNPPVSLEQVRKKAMK